jgi:hypothetical protein
LDAISATQTRLAGLERSTSYRNRFTQAHQYLATTTTTPLLEDSAEFPAWSRVSWSNRESEFLIPKRSKCSYSDICRYHNLSDQGKMPSTSQAPSFPSTAEQTTAITTEKHQPWKAIWPAPRESQPQAQIFGFKKGEVMVFDGNAGNFFARDGWTIEQESSTH